MWCGWSSFWSSRRSGTLGSPDVSMSSGGGEAAVFEEFVEVVLDKEALLDEDDEDAGNEAGPSAEVGV